MPFKPDIPRNPRCPRDHPGRRRLHRRHHNQNRFDMDRNRRSGQPHRHLILHPERLHRQNPEMVGAPHLHPMQHLLLNQHPSQNPPSPAPQGLTSKTCPGKSKRSSSTQPPGQHPPIPPVHHQQGNNQPPGEQHMPAPHMPPLMYGYPGQDRLTATTRDEAVEEILERMCPDQFPDSIQVTTFGRVVISPCGLNPLDHLLEQLDEEHADPEDTESTLSDGGNDPSRTDLHRGNID